MSISHSMLEQAIWEYLPPQILRALLKILGQVQWPIPHLQMVISDNRRRLSLQSFKGFSSMHYLETYLHRIRRSMAVLKDSF